MTFANLECGDIFLFAPKDDDFYTRPWDERGGFIKTENGHAVGLDKGTLITPPGDVTVKVCDYATINLHADW